MIPFVTIIIPVYNGSNFLKQAIDSAIAQTYEHLEIIVINDGSDDNGLTDSIAKSYGEQIRYLIKTNGGVASALNAGIRHARGDFISWLSHDDLYHADKIERQIARLASIPSASIVLYSDYEAIDANNNLIKTVHLNAAVAGGPRQAIIRLLFESSVHGCSLLLPKKCFTEVGYFDETLKTTQDYDLWFKLLKHGYEFMHMPEILISSRWHNDQGTRSLHNIAYEEIEALYVGAIDMLYDDIDKMPVTTIAALVVDLRERRFKRAAHYLLMSIKRRNRVRYVQLHDQFGMELLKSSMKSMASGPLQICNMILNRLGLRGRG